MPWGLHWQCTGWRCVLHLDIKKQSHACVYLYMHVCFYTHIKVASTTAVHWVFLGLTEFRRATLYPLVGTP